MDNALWIAKTGLEAQDKEMAVTANNISNANTVGFKESRAQFSDLMYQNIKQPGAETDENTDDPSGLQVGDGVRIEGTTKNFSEGNAKTTNRPLDVMIQGNGFLQVQKPDGTIAFTRDGGLTKDANGILTTQEGYPITPQITIPQNATSISIGKDGKVEALVAGEDAPQEAGQITLATFVNPAGLSSLGGNLYGATEASGEATVATPGENGTGTLLQGALESSNVSIVNELVKMIQIQRSYEMNSNAISISNKMSEFLTQHTG